MAEANRCRVCGKEVVSIEMLVDGRELEMTSCERCDTRTWNFGGAPVDLELVLAQVGEHAGRRR